jgi:hypothetical protein
MVLVNAVIVSAGISIGIDLGLALGLNEIVLEIWLIVKGFNAMENN